MDGARSLPRLLLLALSLPGIWGGQAPAEHSIIQTEFYQKTLDSRLEGDEFMFDFDGDEIFHVEKEETVWRLPQFQQFASFEAQGALQNIAIDKQNLEISMKAYNNSRAPSMAPDSAVFPKHPVLQDEPNILICSVTKFWPPVLGLSWLKNGAPVEQGVLVAPDSAVFPKHPVLQDEPNILICSVTKFWPPVLGLSWLKNGAPVEQGVVETPFYPDRDNTFRKFSYLPFIPEPGDYYDCKVEHEGLAEPRITHWEPQILAPASEATETVICALGLAVGIVGIAAGTALIIRGMKLGRARAERGVL